MWKKQKYERREGTEVNVGGERGWGGVCKKSIDSVTDKWWSLLARGHHSIDGGPCRPGAPHSTDAVKYYTYIYIYS
jgi:hypothetical protein